MCQTVTFSPYIALLTLRDGKHKVHYYVPFSCFKECTAIFTDAFTEDSLFTDRGCVSVSAEDIFITLRQSNPVTLSVQSAVQYIHSKHNNLFITHIMESQCLGFRLLTITHLHIIVLCSCDQFGQNRRRSYSYLVSFPHTHTALSQFALELSSVCQQVISIAFMLY